MCDDVDTYFKIYMGIQIFNKILWNMLHESRENMKQTSYNCNKSMQSQQKIILFNELTTQYYAKEPYIIFSYTASFIFLCCYFVVTYMQMRYKIIKLNIIFSNIKISTDHLCIPYV